MSISSATFISLVEAARRLPGRPHVSTLYRWCNPGIRGVRLRTVKIGGRRYVELAELDRFIEAVTAASEGKKPTPAPPSAKRDQQIAAAEAELAVIGIAPRPSKGRE